MPNYLLSYDAYRTYCTRDIAHKKVVFEIMQDTHMTSTDASDLLWKLIWKRIEDENRIAALSNARHESYQE